MYESQVSEYRMDIDRLQREMQEVKKKYFLQKKKEQSLRYSLLVLSSAFNDIFSHLIERRIGHWHRVWALLSFQPTEQSYLALLEGDSTLSSLRRPSLKHYQSKLLELYFTARLLSSMYYYTVTKENCTGAPDLADILTYISQCSVGLKTSVHSSNYQ